MKIQLAFARERRDMHSAVKNCELKGAKRLALMLGRI